MIGKVIAVFHVMQVKFNHLHDNSPHDSHMILGDLVKGIWCEVLSKIATEGYTDEGCNRAV